MTEHRINLDDLRTIRDGSGHSIFGPSGSSMWLNCPGSLVPNLLAQDNGGPDAAYGTVAHGVTELWLKEGRRPDHLVGTNEFVEAGDWGHLVWIDESMLDYAQMCVDWVEWLEGEKWVERRVDFSRITPIPRQTGTADLIVYQPAQRRLIVADWKFGKGVPVYAEYNTQGMLYALGALWAIESAHPDARIDEIEIRIGQPRRDHFDEWVISRDDLMLFAGWAKARMALAWSVNAPRIAGTKQCEFCKVRVTCAANAKLQVELTEGVFDDLDSPHPVTVEEMGEFKDRIDDDLMPFDMVQVEAGNLTTGQLAKLYPFRRVADKWWHSIEAELMRRCADGVDLQPFGYKAVEARSRRYFPDFDRAVEALAEMGVPPAAAIEQKIISFENLGKALVKAGHRRKDVPSLLEGITRKPPGKPTIAPLSDKRPALVDLSGVSFDDLDSETDEEEI
jgi:hypothetical protein